MTPEQMGKLTQFAVVLVKVQAGAESSVEEVVTLSSDECEALMYGITLLTRGDQR